MIRASLTTLLAFVALSCACSTATAPPPAEGTAPGATPAVSFKGAAPSGAAPGVAGSWSSPSCGPRAYERRLTLDPAGGLVAVDRVSPCPPSVVCVWSGIVARRGGYTVSGAMVRTVLISIDAGPGPGQPLPAELEIDASGALVEVTPEGARCVYARVRP